MITKKDNKNYKIFICEICDFRCSKKCNYDKHIVTRKHINNDNSLHKKGEIEQIKKYKCECGKEYNHRQGLYTHKKKCKPMEHLDASNNIIDVLINENKDFKNIIMELVKNNNDLQKQMIDVCQKIQPSNTNINSHNNTTNNKTFNLQLFLNEECKDALNMSEFINSIELKMSDLENIGKLGYVEGMSNIIIKQLNDTDMYKRPVHCIGIASSDAKRETLYVKEENKWEKEGPDNNKLIKAVHSVDKKNYLMLNKWKDAHPKYLDGQSKQCDDYMKLMSKVMDSDKENINKVIKKVAKEVVIDKGS
jgi:hypothetical protein